MTHPVVPVAAPESQGMDLDAGLSARMGLAQESLQARTFGLDARAAESASDSVKPSGVSPEQMARLRKVCQDFESVFIDYLMKLGRDTTSKGTFWGHTQGEEIFTDMRDDQLAKRMARAGGIGLSKLLMEQLTRVLQDQVARQNASVAPAAAAES